MARKRRSSGRVGIKQLAEYLSLSSCTVSKILSGRQGQAKYKAETIKRVKEAALKFGYKPNTIARALVQGKSWMVGLCIADIANSVFGEFASVFERAVNDEEYGTFICNSQENPEQELKYVEMLLSRNVDALVISPVSDKVSPLLEDAAKNGCKVVIFDRDIPGSHFFRVSINNLEAMNSLTQNVVSAGHKKIGVLAGNSNDSSLSLRIAGIQKAVSDKGLDPADCIEIVQGAGNDTTVEAGVDAFKKLMSSSFKPTAVIAVANPLCVGGLIAARELGVNIGSDVSFASFDDSREAELFSPGITSVSQPVAEMATACAKLSTGKSTDKSQIFSATIIERGSIAAV
ncbi:MAG: LacI family DNA-binding transcriptional regulator [Planctomycetota bacterium]